MEGVKSSMSQEKKTAEICVRVTPTEKKELQEKADAAHLSLSRYLVKSGSDHKGISKNPCTTHPKSSIIEI